MKNKTLMTFLLFAVIVSSTTNIEAQTFVVEKNVYHENDGMFYTSIDAENISAGIYKMRVVHENLVLIRKWTKI